MGGAECCRNLSLALAWAQPGVRTGGCGVSPAPVLCQVMFVQWVLEGVLGFFLLLSFFLFFTSLPKYLVFLSSRVGGLAQPLKGPGALLCTFWVLLGTGRAGRALGMLRSPMLTALVGTGRSWPGNCQLR